MTQLFLQILNGSIAVGWVVIGLLLLRLVLRKMPKWVHCLLWGVVALRLIVPVRFQSTFSLMPSAQVIPTDITTAQVPAIESGIALVDSTVNPLFTQQLSPQTQLLPQLLAVAGWVWVAGVGAMLLLSLISWLRLKRRLRASLPISQNIYICDNVDSPFVLGIIAPKIYLPSGMEEDRRPYVLAHERAHIRRKDHWWKPLGYLLLSVHWFNPLMWVSYILLCRDIEQACDDKVIKTMSTAEKQGYSLALLACSQRPMLVTACPVAFGEVGVKTRIRGILNYKKPAFWVLTLSCLAVIVAACCFLTDPIPCKHTYESTVTRAPTCTATGVQTQHCSTCGHSYTEPLAVMAHTFDDGRVIMASTCTQAGLLERKCTQCDHTKQETLPLASHTPGEPYSIVEANCIQPGEKGATCTQCKAQFVVEVLPQNDIHDMKVEVIKEATCSKLGEGIATCTRCAYEERISYEKTAHVLGDPYSHISATCINQGVYRRNCTNCDYIEEEYRAKGDHRWMHDLYNSFCLHCGKSLETLRAEEEEAARRPWDSATQIGGTP